MAKTVSKQPSFWQSRKQRQAFWHSRKGMFIELVAALILAYAIASLAINSGSLIQYFLTFLLLGIVINRIVRLFKRN